MGVFGESKAEKTERKLRQEIEDLLKTVKTLRQENGELLDVINEKDGTILNWQSDSVDNNAKLEEYIAANKTWVEHNDSQTKELENLRDKFSDIQSAYEDKQYEFDVLLKKHAHVLAEKTRKTNRDAKKIQELEQRLNHLQDSCATA